MKGVGYAYNYLPYSATLHKTERMGELILSRSLYHARGPLIQPGVLLRRCGPRVVFAHAALAQDRPAVGIAEACQAARDRLGQLLGRVGVEPKAVAVVALAHGVVQAAGGAHDRD